LVDVGGTEPNSGHDAGGTSVEKDAATTANEGGTDLADGATQDAGLVLAAAKIAVGSQYACALTTAGAALCWGDGYGGLLGNGQIAGLWDFPTPISDVDGGVTALSGLTAITANDHACVLTAAGGVLCWGYNGTGQLGNGTTTISEVPTPVSGLASGVTAVAAGTDFTCALTSAGAVLCWGTNGSGELGTGSGIEQDTPTAVTSLASGVTAISAANGHACALTSTGSVLCWGDNANGDVGDGTQTGRPTPTQVSGLTSGVVAIATGGSPQTGGANYSCALTSAGAVQCWGANFNGQIGDGTTTQRLTPTQVTGLTSGVSAISAGGTHACALTTAGAVLCWGDNTYGQLGDGTTTQRLTPTPVTGLSSGVASIAAGPNGQGAVSNTCAVTTSGGIRCWGDNSFTEVGDGETTPMQILVPTPVQFFP
jgi:alpha-tubulin suppressor-like RCC1 family protein